MSTTHPARHFRYETTEGWNTPKYSPSLSNNPKILNNYSIFKDISDISEHVLFAILIHIFHKKVAHKKSILFGLLCVRCSCRPGLFPCGTDLKFQWHWIIGLCSRHFRCCLALVQRPLSAKVSRRVEPISANVTRWVPLLGGGQESVQAWWACWVLARAHWLWSEWSLQWWARSTASSASSASVQGPPRPHNHLPSMWPWSRRWRYPD